MSLTKEQCREIIARRVAQEVHDGDVITLGIGLPTEVAAYIPPQMQVMVQSENGMIGCGQRDDNAAGNARIIDAGGRPVNTRAGAAFFDTAMSLAIMRGGHVDITVMGALQVDSHGNLANWMIPGVFVPGMGGAMDLTIGAKKVIIAMEHTTAKGEPRIVQNCTIPLTAEHEVDMIVTERCVIDVTPEGLCLKEINPLFTLEEIIASTGADLIVPQSLLKAKRELL